MRHRDSHVLLNHPLGNGEMSGNLRGRHPAVAPQLEDLPASGRQIRYGGVVRCFKIGKSPAILLARLDSEQILRH